MPSAEELEEAEPPKSVGNSFEEGFGNGFFGDVFGEIVDGGALGDTGYPNDVSGTDFGPMTREVFVGYPAGVNYNMEVDMVGIGFAGNFNDETAAGNAVFPKGSLP